MAAGPLLGVWAGILLSNWEAWPPVGRAGPGGSWETEGPAVCKQPARAVILGQVLASVKWQWAVPLYRGVLRIQIFCVRCLAHTRRSTHSGPTHPPNLSSYCLDCPEWGMGEVVCGQPVWLWARLVVDYSLSSPFCVQGAGPLQGGVGRQELSCQGI